MYLMVALLELLRELPCLLTTKLFENRNETFHLSKQNSKLGFTKQLLLNSSVYCANRNYKTNIANLF